MCAKLSFSLSNDICSCHYDKKLQLLINFDGRHGKFYCPKVEKDVIQENRNMKLKKTVPKALLNFHIRIFSTTAISQLSK